MTVILETERLRLREIVPADFDFVAEMLADPKVMHFFPRPLTLSQSAAWLEQQLRRYAEDRHGLWLVENRRTGQAIGQVGLLMQNVEGVREPEISYLLHRPFWHCGYATEAGLGVRAFAFGRLEKSSVISLVRPINTASEAVARRLGMVPERAVTFHAYAHVVFRVSRPATGGAA